MSHLQANLNARGFHLKSYAAGQHESICPYCSHTRKKKYDRCCTVTIKDDDEGKEIAIFKCHHCGEGDGQVITGEDEYERGKKRHERRPATVVSSEPPPPKAYVKPEFVPPREDKMNRAALDFLTARGISPATIKAMKIGWNPEKRAVTFPYYFRGEVINVKYRTLDKKFWLEKGAQLALYNLDGILKEDTVIIVEGEMDALALMTCGFTNVVSVPNGAVERQRSDDDDSRMEYLVHAEAILKDKKKFIIAVDNDNAGRSLEAELIRRLGLERCYRVIFPERLKDANQALLECGLDFLCDLINYAEPCPVKGVYRAWDFDKALNHHYAVGAQGGVSTGFYTLDDYFTVRGGEVTTVTGTPGSGKSEFVDAVMVNLAQKEGWSFGVFSSENPPEQHITKLAGKFLRLPFSHKRNDRMSLEEFGAGCARVHDRFFFIVADDEETFPTLDWILEMAKVAIYRYGVKAIVIDPYNEIEHQIPPGMTENNYISRMMAKIKRFARRYDVHIFIIAHPTKPPPAVKGGKEYIPGPYDISGGANWFNKTDNSITVHRPKDADGQVEIHLTKVRFKEVGRRGKIRLKYDWVTGCYSDIDIQDDPILPEDEYTEPQSSFLGGL